MTGGVGSVCQNPHYPPTHEATAAGNHQLRELNGAKDVDVYGVEREKYPACERCDRKHAPRDCPAYDNEAYECYVSGKRGHWTILGQML